MHSFHQSRGRILFDFFCVLVIVASCMGAWIQTGASALIGAAGAAGLYGLVRLFDMRWPKSDEVVEPQRIELEPDARDEPPIVQEVIVPFAAVEAAPEVEASVTEAEPVDLEAPRAKKSRPSKAPRKGGTRRSGAAKLAKVSEAEPVEEPAAVAPLHAEEQHTHVAPLFEPEPFVRMQRQAFGRRGRI